MSDPSALFTDWLGRGFATAFGALIAAGTTIFATRKNNEASVMEAVTKRFQLQFDRYDAEIERLERQMAEERAQCSAELQHLRGEIARLMANPFNAPLPAYTETDIEKGQRLVRGAVRRQSRKGQRNE